MSGDEFAEHYEIAEPTDACGITREVKEPGAPELRLGERLTDALTEPSPDSGFDQGDPESWNVKEQEKRERERAQSLAGDLWMRVGANGLPTWSTGQIADQVKRSPETIRNWKSELGWPERPGVRPKQGGHDEDPTGP